MEDDTSTSHADSKAPPRDEEQCLATLSINSSSIPRSFHQTVPRDHNPSTPRASEGVPRWQNEPDNLIPPTVPRTAYSFPEEVGPRTVPRSAPYRASIRLPSEVNYTLSSSIPTHSSYVEEPDQDIDRKPGPSYQLFSSSRAYSAVNPRDVSASVHLSSFDKQQHGRTDSSFTGSDRERHREDPDEHKEYIVSASRSKEYPKLSTYRSKKYQQASAARSKEYHQASNPQNSANKTQGCARTPIPSGRARDAPDSLDASSRRNQDQQSADADHSQLLTMSVSPPASRRNPPSALNAMRNADRDSLEPPTDLVGQFIVDDFKRLSMRWLQFADISHAPITKDRPKDKSVGPPQVSAEPVRIQMEPGSFNSGNEHSGGECCTSQSTPPGMELQMTELEDALNSVAMSNVSPVETTDATDSENLSSEDEHGQIGFPAGPLQRHLTARLVAGWLCDALGIEFRNLANNSQKCSQGSETGQAGRTGSKRPLTGSPYWGNNNSSGAETGNGSDQERDDEFRRPRRKIPKVHNPSTGSPRLLACPFHKMNPIRYSGLNEREKEYRRCSSGYWPDISRLKQHLNRAHGRPKFYCPSCYTTFKTKKDLDSHLRRRPACEVPSEPRYEEKMNDEQSAEINKKHPGMSMHDCWNMIFTVLFPHARVPESPYAPERDMERNLQERFHRERSRILSSLCQGYLQPVFPWDPNVLDRMYQQCWQECVAVVTQLLASGTGSALSQRHANALLTPPFDEVGPPNSYSSVQPGPTSMPQQNWLNPNLLQLQQWPTSQNYPFSSQPNGISEASHIYSNMGSTSLTILDCRAPLEPPDAGDAGVTLDFGPPPHEIANQNASWDVLPFMHRSDPGHLCS